MKTYHMYHVETISAESKLREAERQEGRVKGVSGTGGGGEPVFGLRIEERHQRRNAARKMEKMREKVCGASRLPPPVILVQFLLVSDGSQLGDRHI